MPKRPQDLDTHITDIHQMIPPARLTTRLKGGTSKTECIAPPRVFLLHALVLTPTLPFILYIPPDPYSAL